MIVRSFAVVFALFLVVFVARVDWEGDVEMKNEMMAREGAYLLSGKVCFKKDGKLRMDMQMGPMEMTSIVDWLAHKLTLINHSTKTFSEMSDDHPNGGSGPSEALPKCKSMKFTKCMKKQNYKKTDNKTVNNQTSTIWE